MKSPLAYIDTSLGLIYERIGQSTMVDIPGLALYRIFYGVFLLLYFIPSWRWIGDMPQGFFNPPLMSIANFSNNFPPTWILTGMDVIFIALIGFITIGFYTRISFFLAFLVATIGFSYSYSFGKIDHGTTLFIFSLLILSFTNCGTKYAIRADTPIHMKYHKWALRILGIIIVFGFFTAGLSKFIKWIDFDLGTSGFLSWFYPGYFMFKRQDLLANVVFSTPYLLLEIADYTVAFFEVLAFVFLIKGKKYWLTFLLILCTFHLGNMLILNIEFTFNILAYSVFLIPVFLRNSLSKKSFHFSNYKTVLVITTFLLGVWQLLFQYWTYNSYHSASFYFERYQWYLYLSIIPWVSIILIGFCSLRHISRIETKE